jgi:hypothetical protein
MSEPTKNDYPTDRRTDPDSGIFHGFERVQSEEDYFGSGITAESDLLGTKDDRKPLYFLIFASLVLLAVIMLIVYVKIIATGGQFGRATPAPYPSTSSSAQASPTETATAELRSALSKLTDNPTCSDISGAITTIETFAESSEGGDGDVAAVSSALTALSKQCGADSTVELYEGLSKPTQKFPTAIYELVTSREWFSLAKAAPDGAVDTKEFASPSNNIRCQIGDTSISCSIYAYSYASPEGCEGYTATYTVDLAGETAADCKSEVNAATIVAYGSSVAANGFACTVDDTQGVECWSELSGHGFSLKRSAGTTF